MLQPIARPSSLSDEVFRALESRLQSGEFAPGERLPTEKQLSEAFGVSRAVVREAVARLKADGYVETRQGAGAYVAAQPGGASFRLGRGDGFDADGVRQIFELRLLVEVGAAELAARRRTDEDLRALRTELERMGEALERGADASAADDRFHRAIAAATHNGQVRRFMEFLGHQFSDSRRPTWSADGHQQGRARAAQKEHERLFAAIAAGDRAGPRRAAESHLRNAAKRLGLEAMGEDVPAKANTTRRKGAARS